MKRMGVLAGLAAVLLLRAAPVSALSDTAHGYGQGSQLDEERRPLGALDLNAQYGALDACALTQSDGILLTFDQGYENGYTGKILDVLKEKQVTAIFFLTGDYAKQEHALVERMIDEGHVLGNHGMTHGSLPFLSPEELETEVMSLHNYVLEEYGYEMQYFRPPCGEYSEAALSAVKELGYHTVFWSFAYVDWLTDQQPDRASALERITGGAHPGAIYLLHSVSKTNSEVLGEAIDCLREQGYTL